MCTRVRVVYVIYVCSCVGFPPFLNKLYGKVIEGKTHTHTFMGQKSHYLHNWTERRDYVQIKIRMHTHKDQCRLSLLATTNTTKARIYLFICHIIHQMAERLLLLLWHFQAHVEFGSCTGSLW